MTFSTAIDRYRAAIDALPCRESEDKYCSEAAAINELIKSALCQAHRDTSDKDYKNQLADKIAQEYWLLASSHISLASKDSTAGSKRHAHLYISLQHLALAQLYRPTCPDTLALKGRVLIERGQLAEGIQSLYEALAQPLRKWKAPSLYAGFAELASSERQRAHLAQGEWRCLDLAVTPIGRSFAAYTQVGSSLYLFGGECTSGVLHDLWVFCMASCTWKHLDYGGQKPSPRTRAVLWHCDGCLYLHGGLDGVPGRDQPLGGFADLHCFHLDSQKWFRVKPKKCGPSPRHGHVVAVVASKAFLWGGHSVPADNRIWVLDMKDGLKSLKWHSVAVGGNRPSPRCHAMSWVLDDKLIIKGGEDMLKLEAATPKERADGKFKVHAMHGEHAESGSWICSLNADPLVWTYQDDGILFPGFSEAGCASHEGMFYAFGGYSTIWDRHCPDLQDGLPQERIGPSNYFKCLFRWDQKWHMVVLNGESLDAPCCRAGSAAAAWQGSCFVFGGYTCIRPNGENRKRGKYFRDTWSCTTHAFSSTGEISVSQRAGPPTARVQKFHVESWKEACRRLVTENMGLRKEFSEAAVKAMEVQGEGCFLGLFPISGDLSASDMMQLSKFSFCTPSNNPLSGTARYAFTEILKGALASDLYERDDSFVIFLMPETAPLDEVDNIEYWGNYSGVFIYGLAGGCGSAPVEKLFLDHDRKRLSNSSGEVLLDSDLKNKDESRVLKCMGTAGAQQDLNKRNK